MIQELIDLVPVQAYAGEAPTGAHPPYVVVRPGTVAVADDTTALCGLQVAWDVSYDLHCRAGSGEASWNIALDCVTALQGTRTSQGVLSCTVNYTGALVEGAYETQLSVQLYQGELT